MTRDEFLSQLRKNLKRLPKEELEDVLSYYSEYFDEAGPENEQSALEELGSPARIASQILLRNWNTSPKTAKKGLSAVWMVILAIFASPIALPLALAAVILILALLIVMLALWISFAAIVIALILTGVLCLVSGICVVGMHLPTALFYCGVGLVAAAIGLALSIPTLRFIRGSSQKIAQLFSKLVTRRVKE